jgi:hypothetical protein
MALEEDLTFVQRLMRALGINNPDNQNNTSGKKSDPKSAKESKASKKIEASE